MTTAADAPFPYRLVRSRRRSVAIYVRDGGIEVRAPQRAPLYWINRFVADKAAWIERRLAEDAVRAQQVLQLAPGERIPLLGEPKTLHIERATRHGVRIEGDALVLSARNARPETLLRVFRQWTSTLAADYIPPRAAALAAQLGVAAHLQGVRFRHTRSKWGHCTSRGILQFNPLIMLAPEPVVHYLVAHEVGHLLHMNHSAAYWDSVAQVCPDHAVQRRWLRANEHRFRIG